MTFVDSNVILDIFTNDPVWEVWSSDRLDECALEGPLVINDIVYAEVSSGFASVAEIDSALQASNFMHLPLSREALFDAAKAFRKYRARGGAKTGVIADFFVGAHAQALGCPLLTRDPDRFRKYFRSLKLITPDAI